MNWFTRLLRRNARGHDIAAAGAADAAGAHIQAGNALLGQGRLADAAEQYLHAVRIDPRHVDGHVNLGFALVEQGRADEALAPLRQALALAPDSHDAHYLIGAACLARRAPAAAVDHLQRAIALKPDLAVAYRDLGRALHEVGRNAQALEVLCAGLAVSPGSADLHYFLGNVQSHEMDLDAALASYQRALDIQPGYASVYSNMAPALSNLGDFEGAAVAARKALAIDPSMHHARSNLLVALSCDPRCSPEDYLVEARLYGQMLMAQIAPRPAVPGIAIPVEPSGASRRLRIGFVSGDLRGHPVGYFLESVLRHWDSLDMDAIAYSNHPGHDDLTARLKARFSAWRDVSAMSDEAAAQQIEADRVDVLIDLSGHTADNRLPLFARRPAPVQVSWLGYWASTGLPAIDYLLADPVSVPPRNCVHFTEAIWYVPDTRLCFTAPAETGVPEVTAPPALQAGHITFGSFQRLTKINDRVLGLWARVLHAVPKSRLRIQAAQLKDPAARACLLHRLEAVGIDAARVRLAEAGTRVQYLAAHAQVDILLDTFPHSGATTTCEALWMGVPTITLAGTTMLSRQGASLLECAGLAQWIAGDEDDFVACAVRHAGDLVSLARLRLGLRAQVAVSPLFDAARFTQLFQHALRGMWQQKACGLSVENTRFADARSPVSTPGLP